jgi:hypothetical protein
VTAEQDAWQPGDWIEQHALVLLTFDPGRINDHGFMMGLAHKLQSLENTEQSDPDLVYAMNIVNDRSHVKDRRQLLPMSMTSGAVVYVADIELKRSRLEQNYLSSTNLTCIAEHKDGGRIELVPWWIVAGLKADPSGESAGLNRNADRMLIPALCALGVVLVLAYIVINGTLFTPRSNSRTAGGAGAHAGMLQSRTTQESAPTHGRWTKATGNIGKRGFLAPGVTAGQTDTEESATNSDTPDDNVSTEVAGQTPTPSESNPAGVTDTPTSENTTTTDTATPLTTDMPISPTPTPADTTTVDSPTTSPTETPGTPPSLDDVVIRSTTTDVNAETTYTP